MKFDTAKIFISGGGDSTQSSKLDFAFVQSLLNKRILYIPIALDRDGIGFEACYDWIVSSLTPHSSDFLEIVMNVHLPSIDSVDTFGGLYIGGGNTFKLLHVIYEGSFQERVFDVIRNGGILYGGSAGAIIMGDNINTVQEENLEGYEISKGLSLLNGYSVICHYSARDDDRVLRFIDVHRTPVIALPEDVGLMINGTEAAVVGFSPVTIFNNRKIKHVYAPGERIPDIFITCPKYWKIAV